jgi:hypothetical protein
MKLREKIKWFVVRDPCPKNYNLLECCVTSIYCHRHMSGKCFSFLWNGWLTPSLCIQRMHIAFFFIWLFIEFLKEPRSQRQPTDRYTYQTDEGGDHEQSHVPCHHNNAHHLKPTSSTSYPSTAKSILSPTLSTGIHTHSGSCLRRLPRSHLQNGPTYWSCRLAVNATMTSKRATILRRYIKPRESLRLRCATLSRVIIVDKVDPIRFALEPLDEDMTHWVLTFSIPVIDQGKSPLEVYMKSARTNMPTWSRRQETPCKP